MMRATDLAPLFKQPAAAVGLRQGTVLAWNQLTGENTIDVGGATVTDLPVFNTSEALLIQPGDVVNILTMGAGTQSWGILGRIIIPGTPQAASALSLVANQIITDTDATAGTTASGTYGNLSGTSVGPQVTVPIRSSRKAVVWWSAEFGFTGAFEEESHSGVSIAVSGATTVAASGAWSLAFHLEQTPAGTQSSLVLQASNFHVFENLNPGDNTFTMQYRTPTAGGSDPDTVEFSQREIAVLAL